MWGPRVLLACRDPEVRARLATALSADGHRIVEAADEQELLDHLGSSFLFGAARVSPDVIVAEDAMISGAEVDTLVALRDVGVKTPLVIVSMSATGTPLSTSIGASATFRAPFDVDDLRTVVLNLVPEDGWLRERWSR